MLVCHTAQCISIAEREAPVVCPHMMPRDNCANTKRSRPSQKRKSGALAGQGNHIIIFAEIDINSDNIWTMCVKLALDQATLALADLQQTHQRARRPHLQAELLSKMRWKGKRVPVRICGVLSF